MEVKRTIKVFIGLIFGYAMYVEVPENDFASGQAMMNLRIISEKIMGAFDPSYQEKTDGNPYKLKINFDNILKRDDE